MHELWRDVVLQFYNRFLNGGEIFSYNFPKLKYKVYKELTDLIKVLLQKYIQTDHELELSFGENQREKSPHIVGKISGFLDQISIKDFIHQSLEIKINFEQYKRNQENLEEGLYIENKHLVLNVNELLDKSNLNQVLSFVKASVELFHTYLLVAISYIRAGNTEDPMVQDVILNYCLKESFDKYLIVLDKGSTSINILLSLVSLLKYDQTFYDSERKYKMDFCLDPQLFSSKEAGEEFISKVEP